MILLYSSCDTELRTTTTAPCSSGTYALRKVTFTARCGVEATCRGVHEEINDAIEIAEMRIRIGGPRRIGRYFPDERNLIERGNTLPTPQYIDGSADHERRCCNSRTPGHGRN